ncbi:hypothetical protein [Ellagibacter isourolithinifaciens]|uniref:hypothetical protein n=1 Tax=Ellagibacter isourolithinifaciens TaxID=2137581 RepID=UPI003A8D7758
MGRRLWRAPGGASAAVQACDDAGVAEREATPSQQRGAMGAAPHQTKGSHHEDRRSQPDQGHLKTVKEGGKAVAIIKATDVMVAVD